MKFFHMDIVSKLIIFIGVPLLVVISAWAFFNINFQEAKLMQHVITDTERLTETIRLGTHYAMTLNSRDDINQIIQNISQQKGIEEIHIYNKEGEIAFSNIEEKVSTKTNIKDGACSICHQSDPPLLHIDLEKRTRIFNSGNGYRLMGILTPIYNEPGCASAACHFHPENKNILGALDVVVSLREQDKAIADAQIAIAGLSILGFFVMSGIIFLFVHRFIHVPVRKLIDGTVSIAGGNYETKVALPQQDEMGQLATAINRMADQINIQQTELSAQKEEYQTLFDDAPCMISVQDRNYKLLRYNRQFMENFNPRPGVTCYQVYKGLDEKCDNCPVEKTFIDGKSHLGETSGVGWDGITHHWMFITSPIMNAKGEVVSAIEMSLDITKRIQLEKQLEASEKKYLSIFSNIPNPVFVLDNETLCLIDCNQRVSSVYGFSKKDILGRSFIDLFIDDEKDKMMKKIRSVPIINQARQKKKDGKILYVDIWISPSEYEGKKILLVTTSDITKRLETEQELIQAGKMATLGEMSTGIAHELNQPLSVIKTASDFILKKMDRNEWIEPDIYHKLMGKINANVDRASKIIEHMRHFARKSDINFENINVNHILKRAHDIFSQQLKVRGIEVVWDLEEKLPQITADPGRIEQVFINLLVNARDAIEEKSQKNGETIENETITIKSELEDRQVAVYISDTGIGMKEDIREKIFEPFFTTKEVGKGTGLGLSISYGIIKECKGDIDVSPNAESGEGTTFTLRFPKARETGTNIS